MSDINPQRTGRVSQQIFPLEIQLARFISTIKNPHESWKDSIPGYKWAGVTCNVGTNSIIIHWSYDDSFSHGVVKAPLKGNLQWRYFPAKVEEMRFSFNGIGGGIDTSSLSSPLLELLGSVNALSGPLCLEALPQNLRELCLRSNDLIGTLNLTDLPPSLERLWLNFNHFSGEIELSALPSSLHKLLLYGNQLSGTVDFTQLREGIEKIDLGRNQFNGTADLSNLPKSLKSISLLTSAEEGERNVWKISISEEWERFSEGCWRRIKT